ncbi:MAG TPA: cysteine desulfurase [Gammaproteobacteria bacterium]|nr:cysteine desulfurase [Gammaproteobacteria bacterium]
MVNPVYLDCNATTPVDERVQEAMAPFWRRRFANPSSVHKAGREARAALELAREQVAALVGAHPSQVIFTSGGTEANNLALFGTAGLRRAGRVLVSAVEHPSVLEPAAALARRGGECGRVPVDPEGRVTLSALEQAWNGGVGLVSVMWANNETGVIQDVTTLAARVRGRGALFHTDAVQAAGKLALDFPASGVHLMSLSSHKIYGPKGAGALIVDRALELEPLLYGGGQEQGRRSGTENVAAIVGFGAAAALAAGELDRRRRHVRRLREQLERTLSERLPQVVIFGSQAPRLPNTTMLALPGVDGETLLMHLDEAGFAVASGSACASADPAPSHVLRAMGVEESLARGAIRVSLGQQHGAEDVEALVAALVRVRRVLGALAAENWQ